jgi:hypothetical protein
MKSAMQLKYEIIEWRVFFLNKICEEGGGGSCGTRHTGERRRWGRGLRIQGQPQQLVICFFFLFSL